MNLHPASRTWLHRLYLLCVFLFLLLIFWLIPPTHDDWYHEDSQTLFHGLIAHSAAWYRNLNGRILGNALISVTGGHPLLRAFLQSLFVWGIWMTAGRILKMPFWLHHLFLLGLFSLPSALYAQTYGWASGFFNYVPEVLGLLLVVLSLLRSGSSPAGRKRTLFLIVGCLAAFSSSFFAENITALHLLLGLGLLIFAICRHNGSSLPLASVGLSFLCGGAVMFLSPAYRKSSYYRTGCSLSELLEILNKNYPQVSSYTIGYYVIPCLLLTVLLIFLLSRKNTAGKCSAPAWLLMTALSLGTMYFIAYHVLLSDKLVLCTPMLTILFDFLVTAVWAASVMISLYITVEDRFLRALTVGAFLLTIFYAAPLLLVSPIGPRCFYTSYILLLLSCAGTLQYAVSRIFAGEISLIRHAAGKSMLFSLTAAVVLTYSFVSLKNHAAFSYRTAVIQAGMEAGYSEIELPYYPYPQYIHAPNSQTIGQYYYYETANDITFTFAG